MEQPPKPRSCVIAPGGQPVNRVVQSDDLAREQFAIPLYGLRDPANIILRSDNHSSRLPRFRAGPALLFLLQLHATDMQQNTGKENVCRIAPSA
jgi:hypothetical protein